MDGFGPWLFPVAGFRASCAETSGYIARELVA